MAWDFEPAVDNTPFQVWVKEDEEEPVYGQLRMPAGWIEVWFDDNA